MDDLEGDCGDVVVCGRRGLTWGFSRLSAETASLRADMRRRTYGWALALDGGESKVLDYHIWNVLLDAHDIMH